MRVELVLTSPKTREKTSSYLSANVKKLFPFLLLFMNASASAEWLKIKGTAANSAEKLIDVETIRQTGPMNTMRRFWELNHLTERAPNKALSIKSYMEYDCKDRRVRVLEESSFTEYWAQGEKLALTVHDSQLTKWNAIGKRSINETVFKRVCPHDESDTQAR